MQPQSNQLFEDTKNQIEEMPVYNMAESGAADLS
jgi:hypothetical protein